MAWSISISAEGWAEIREQLEGWHRERLVAAITDDRFEHALERAGERHAARAAEAERRRLEAVPHDALVDRAYDLVAQTNTCDSGGWSYWVDREGYHKVHLSEADGT
jgi:hypothetical protein